MTDVETIPSHSESPVVDFDELVADIKSSLLQLNPTHDPRNLKAVVFACRPEILKMKSEGATWPDINRIFEERGFIFKQDTIRIYCSKTDLLHLRADAGRKPLILLDRTASFAKM
jgi:hypothetical protein